MDPASGNARSRRRWPPGRAALVAAAVAALALLAWALRPPHDGDDSLERVRRSGVLRVGYAVEAPYAFVGPGGLVTGEAPEGAKRIAEQLGIRRIEWFQTTLDALIPALRERRFDVAAAGLFISDERSALVLFSTPTVQARLGLLLPRGNPKRVRSCTDALAVGGLRFAVIDGSVEESMARRLGLTAATLVVVPDVRSGSAAVAARNADALALSVPALRWLVMTSPGSFEIVADGAGGTPQRSAYAFHPADTALQRAWNRALAGWIGSPDHLALAARFGFAADDVVELR